MAFGFDSVLGWIAPTFEDLQARVAEIYEAETGIIVDLEQPSPTLYLINTLARTMKAAYDDQGGTYGSGFVGSAQGAGLRNLLLPVIGAPLEDVASTVVLPLGGTPATVVGAGSTVVLDSDGPGALTWTLLAPVVIPGDGTFQYAEPGPKSAPAASTWSIAGAGTVGWDTVGPNVADASQGRLAETDAEYRSRYQLSIRGSRIAAAVLAVPGVTAVNVFENQTDIPDDYWGETHWIEVLVQGGDDLAIAQAIQSTRCNTVHTLGTTSVAVAEPNYPGGQVTIRFSRPNTIDVWVSLAITPGEGYSSDGSTAAAAAREAAMTAYILAWAAQRPVGLDVTSFQVATVAATTPTVPGIANITAFVDTVFPPVQTSVEAGPRDLLVFDAARISFTGV